MYKEKNINLNKLLQELYPKSQFSSFTSQNSLPKKRTHLSLHNSHYPTLSTQNGITLVALVITILFSYDEKIKCSNSKGFLLTTI